MLFRAAPAGGLWRAEQSNMMGVGTGLFAANASSMLAIQGMRAITCWASAGRFHLCDTLKAAPQSIVIISRPRQLRQPVSPTSALQRHFDIPVRLPNH
jgi:hypothetical protein